jgi:hypothetical protein
MKRSALLDEIEALVVDVPQPDPAQLASVRANARFAGELVSRRSRPSRITSR